MAFFVRSERGSQYPHNAGILASALNGLDDFMRSKGVDSANLLGRYGLSGEYISSSTDRLPLYSYCKVFEEAAFQASESNFGLKFGVQFDPHSLGLLGYLALSSETLGAALEAVQNFFPIHQQGTYLSLSTHRSSARLDYRVDQRIVKDRRHDAEMSVSCFQNIFRSALGRAWSPDLVMFEHSAPREILDHDDAFCCRVSFERDCNSIIFDRSVMQAPMPGRDPSLFKIVKESLELLASNNHLASSTGGVGFAALVRREVEKRVGSGNVNLDSMSEHLKIPVWTLKRRLAESGINFSMLIDDIRREWATHYIRCSENSISEIAFLLGYSEVSAFSRAFLRWYGLSPLQYRRKNLSQTHQSVPD